MLGKLSPLQSTLVLLGCLAIAIASVIYAPATAGGAAMVTISTIVAFLLRPPGGQAPGAPGAPGAGSPPEPSPTVPEGRGREPGGLRGLVLGLFLLPLALGCASASGARREQARAAVLATAEGLHVADAGCAALALVRKDRDLAVACADGYDVGRAGILGSASAVDAWDTAPEGRERVACNVAAALGGLETMIAAIRAKGGDVPPVVADARALVAVLGGGCPSGAR